MSNLTAILTSTGQSVVTQIQGNLASTGTNATGRTSRSVRFEITTEGTKEILRVWGRKYFFAVETGRKPKGDKPSMGFVQAIKEWMAAKGVEGSAYGIARAINKKGSKLFREGGRKDIVSNVVNQSLYDQIIKSVLEENARAYINIFK